MRYRDSGGDTLQVWEMNTPTERIVLDPDVPGRKNMIEWEGNKAGIV